MVSAREPLGAILTVRHFPAILAWTAIFAVLPSVDQVMDVVLPWRLALTPGAAGVLLLIHGIGGMAAGWV